MTTETQAPRETQEQSIKARKHELFAEEKRVEVGGPRRPFRAYLGETPAAPLSLGVRSSLIGTGVVVGLLFLAAVGGGQASRVKVPTGSVVPVNSRPVASLTPPNPKPAPAPAPAADKKDDKVVANASNPKPDKPKPDKPRSSRPKSKPKPRPEGSELAKDSTPKPKVEPEPAPRSDSPAPAAPSVADGNPTAPAPFANNPPPKKKVSTGLFKKPKPYNPKYPPREKKDQAPDPSDSPMP